MHETSRQPNVLRRLAQAIRKRCRVMVAELPCLRGRQHRSTPTIRYPEQGSICSQVISRSALSPLRGWSIYVLSTPPSKQSKSNPIGFSSQR